MLLFDCRWDVNTFRGSSGFIEDMVLGLLLGFRGSLGAIALLVLQDKNYILIFFDKLKKKCIMPTVVKLHGAESAGSCYLHTQ